MTHFNNIIGVIFIDFKPKDKIVLNSYIYIVVKCMVAAPYENDQNYVNK
jgi:hypothetical protein